VNKVHRIALAGYARVGKDEAAKPLIERGYTRVAFGDIIKRQVDSLVQQHLGFSAFTEDNAQKQQIRPILEQWGEVNYDNIMAEFFGTLPQKAVNTRLTRAREALEWVRCGGVIVEIRRPGVGPATDWERERLEELRGTGLITHVIENNGRIENLADKMLQLVGV